MYCKNCGKEIKDGSAFCTYCGAGTKGEKDYTAAFREIVGKNADYYLARKDGIQKGEKDKMNWASFFLSMLHAGYRNMWRTWLKKMWIPLALSLAGTTLGQMLLFIQPSVSMVLNLIGGIGSIWLLAAQILYAKKFNRMYLEHVEEKIARDDRKQDISIGRAVAAAVILAVVSGVLGAISSAGMMAGLLGGMDGDSEEYTAELSQEPYQEPYSDESAPEAEETPLIVPAEEEEEGVHGPEDYASWVEDYQRTTGPACTVSVWEADEEGILFVANIGYSGANAYVDMRDCTAVWVDETTAAYHEGDYSLIFTMTDGTLQLAEAELFPYGDLSIAGTYVPMEEAVYPDCEFVFPFSSEYEVMEVDCDGLTAEECQIAKNEIYARHGRMFDDPMLQNYFDSCSWYEPVFAPEDFTEDMLSDTEKASIWGIEAYEGYMGY